MGDLKLKLWVLTFVWKGNWYRVWCKYRDRKMDRIRDCFIAPVSYSDDGSVQDDLSGLKLL